MPVVRNPQYYFREGFCWTNVLLPTLEESMYVKCRYKEKSINDVASMSLYPMSDIPSYYFISIIVSSFFYKYLKAFINSTVNLQINDFRMFPIIIPTPEQLQKCKSIFEKAVTIRKAVIEGTLSKIESEKELNEIQQQVEVMVNTLYVV